MVHACYSANVSKTAVPAEKGEVAKLIYTVEKATLLTSQLQRFSTGYAHHVAGQYASVEFWLLEVESALRALDEYNSRFNRMRNAQQAWVDVHGMVTHAYCPICCGRCEFSDGVPAPPIRTANGVLQETRRALSDAGYEFLLRCYRQGLVEEKELKLLCNRMGSGFDPSDLEAAKANL